VAAQCSVAVEPTWNWRGTDHGKGCEDGLQHASGVTPSLSGSTSRWDTLPRLGALERPSATLPHAFQQARTEQALPTIDGRDSGQRARRRAGASGVSLPGVPMAPSAGIWSVPLARRARRGLRDAAWHAGPVGVMMGWTTFNMRANGCRSRVAMAPLNVAPCDGAMRRGEWCKTGGTHRVDGRRACGLHLAPKGPMRSLPCDRCALMSSALHAHLWITALYPWCVGRRRTDAR